jgi:hypothetical protein
MPEAAAGENSKFSGAHKMADFFGLIWFDLL